MRDPGVAGEGPSFPKGADAETLGGVEAWRQGKEEHSEGTCGHLGFLE